MAEQTNIENQTAGSVKNDCGCGCGGSNCGAAGQDCGCGCGGDACGTNWQEMVWVDSPESGQKRERTEV